MIMLYTFTVRPRHSRACDSLAHYMYSTSSANTFVINYFESIE